MLGIFGSRNRHLPLSRRAGAGRGLNSRGTETPISAIRIPPLLHRECPAILMPQTSLGLPTRRPATVLASRGPYQLIPG